MKNKKFKSTYKIVNARKSKKCKTVKTRKSKKYKNLTKKIGGSNNNTATDTLPASNNIYELIQSKDKKMEILEGLHRELNNFVKHTRTAPPDKSDFDKLDKLKERITDLESEIETLNKQIKKNNDKNGEVYSELNKHGPQTIKGFLGKILNKVPPLEQKAVGRRIVGRIVGGASLFVVVAIGGLVTILVNQ